MQRPQRVHLLVDHRVLVAADERPPELVLREGLILAGQGHPAFLQPLDHHAHLVHLGGWTTGGTSVVAVSFNLILILLLLGLDEIYKCKKKSTQYLWTINLGLTRAYMRLLSSRVSPDIQFDRVI